MLHGAYDDRLVLLSYMVAVLASLTALNLAERVSTTTGTLRRVWLFGGACTMGLGIWSMHFTGMLAFSLPIPIRYDLPLVAASLLVAVIASALALGIVSRPTPSIALVGVGGVFMGLGIAAMHYTGMAAIRLPAALHYHTGLLLTSILIAIAASIVALWLALQFRGAGRLMRWRKLASAAVMGVAIVGMHYTGMVAAEFTPTAQTQAANLEGVNYFALGVAIGGGTLLILTLTLIGIVLNQRFLAQSAELEAVFVASPDPIIVLDPKGAIVSLNPAATRLFGANTLAAQQSCFDLIDPLDHPTARAALNRPSSQTTAPFDLHVQPAVGPARTMNITSIVLASERSSGRIYWLARDLTAARTLEAAQLEAQAKLLAAQEALLLELSTPLIPVAANVLVLPLIGTLTPQRVDGILATVLQAISSQRASSLIVDLTGVSEVGAPLFDLIIRVSQGVRLLGAVCILTGISAKIALELAEMSIGVDRIQISPTLATAISAQLAANHALS